MPYTGGGTETHLQEYSDPDRKDNFAIFGNEIRAQSFTPQVSFYLYAVSLKLLQIGFPGDITASIQRCTADGKPDGTDLDSQTVDTFDIRFKIPHWRVFYFPKMPYLTKGYRYAIVLKAPSGNWLNILLWRGWMWENPYNRGTEMYSLDNGATWTKETDYDADFRTWGFEPPTTPPPAPAISNWAVQHIYQYQLIDGFKIVVITDSECHLWLRWTNVAPQIHKEAVMKRGMMWHADLRFCFVAYHENEQEEPGDTLVHTFYKRNWPVCETRWFYFIGSRVDETQPSTSPIFEKHFEGKGWALAFEEPWTRTIIGPPEYDMVFSEPWTS